MSLDHSEKTTFNFITPTWNTDELVISDHACKVILYLKIPNVKIRVWDIIILIPNFLFLLFLIIRFNKARLKLRASNSPIFLTFYCLVILDVIISTLRCVISMVLSSLSLQNNYVDIILWIIVRFFLLMTEISVVIFGLAFGHLDSRTSIRHVLLITSFISLTYSICQSLLETLKHDENFRVSSNGILLFGYGGVEFWFISSIIFILLYAMIIVLPWTWLKEKLPLPEKKSFYVYISILVLLNISCSIGGGLLLFAIKEGLCVIDITTCLYFTFYTPLVYYTFLSDFLDISQPSISFSYRNQADETVEDDNVSLSNQQSLSSVKTSSDCMYQMNNVYESTHFNTINLVNPLYIASLQSPESITGYSLESQIIDFPSSNKS
ncbi:hypothetical protein PGB90_010318 [Kerria lacca]